MAADGGGPVPLTSLSSCTGCAAKVRPELLAGLLSALPRFRSRNVLVGYQTSDDAAVYRLSASQAVVQTVDFFPPVVDDPYAFGQIAAANALSDIWAMGARPLFALNVLAFPKELPARMLKQLLAGGADKAREAGIPVIGGHSIHSPEPKYGMAVTGLVHPKRILRNDGGRPGDRLILTKPIGTGIAATAMKRGLASKGLARQVTEQMAQLNKRAGEVFVSGGFKVNALTDVTGFGLLGHLLELARGAKLRARIQLEHVPILEGIPQLARAQVVPGGSRTNLAHVGKWVKFPARLPEHVKLVLADAQTNGGLLAAVPAQHEHQAVAALLKAGVFAAVIGWLERGQSGIEVE